MTVRNSKEIGHRSCILCSIMILAILLIYGTAVADIPIKGMKDYYYEYILYNINDFPDYIFLTSSSIWGWKHATMIDKATGSFGGGYKLDGFRIHAIKSDDFKESLWHNSRSKNDQETNCAEYCGNNSKIVTSDLNLPKALSLKEDPLLDKIVVYLIVDEISDNALNISKTRIVYYNINGTIRNLPVA